MSSIGLESDINIIDGDQKSSVASRLNLNIELNNLGSKNKRSRSTKPQSKED